MRIVLDSSVVTAAFAARGISEALFEHCLESHEIFMCPEQLACVCRELVDRAGVPGKIEDEIASYLKFTPWPTSPAEVEPETCRDPKYVAVLGVARAAQAHCVITGDPALLALKEYRGTKIVDPRSFWSILVNTRLEWTVR